MKSYTDINQSKKLAEILPLESADMYYAGHQSIINPKEWEYEDTPKISGKYISFDDKRIFYPCWSLAALLNILPEFIGDYGKCLYYDVGGYYCGYMDDGDFMVTIQETKADNPVDACYKMILELYELKLL